MGHTVCKRPLAGHATTRPTPWPGAAVGQQRHQTPRKPHLVACSRVTVCGVSTGTSHGIRESMITLWARTRLSKRTMAVVRFTAVTTAGLVAVNGRPHTCGRASRPPYTHAMTGLAKPNRGISSAQEVEENGFWTNTTTRLLWLAGSVIPMLTRLHFGTRVERGALLSCDHSETMSQRYRSI